MTPPGLRLRTCRALLLLGLVAVGAGCTTGEGGGWSYAALVDVKSFRAEDGERRLEYRVTQGEGTALRARVELTAGSLGLTVLDPQGREAFAESFAAPWDDVTDARFSGPPGEWQVVVEFRDQATGRYDLRAVTE